MSPERKFKSDALLNLRGAAAASVFDEGEDETTRIAVPMVKSAEKSEKRAVKTAIHRGESTLYSRGKSKKPGSKIKSSQSVESQTRSSSQVTPKTSWANKPQHSPLPSFSPIDYRPQNHDANVADCPETTSMLKSYVELWTKPPSDDNANSDNDDTVGKHTQPILDMNRADSTGSLDGPLPGSWESNVPSLAMAYENLDVEYGRLALIKQELERKMQVLDLWMPRASFPETTNDNAVATREGIAGRDEIPSQEDVAFGEMAYRRRMAELGTPMINFPDRPTDDGDYAATSYKVGKNDFAKHHPDNYHKKCDNAYERSPTKAKTKKRRKRRVVETITRVIHEESEEEGSAYTGGGHGWNLKDHRPRTGRCMSSEKRLGDDGHTWEGPYNAYDGSESDSSQSLDGNERHSFKTKGWMRKETMPPSSESTYSTLPEKKRQKRNHDLNNRNRFQRSQPSMLESLN